MKNTKLCCIGGGHGLSVVLYSIKDFTYISAIVAVTDSGGSTGKIRSKFECPAIGDIRKCIDCLGNEQLKDIFERRIKDYGDCVGNLIMASLIKLYDFNTAIHIMHKLLGLRETHNIIPVSLENFDICGKYKNEDIIKKETEFTKEDKIMDIWLHPIPKANPEAIKAIINSDYLIISPGSFFTSILTHFLIPEITKEINKKKIIWITNTMQQFGETIGMDLNAHADYLLKYINHIDYAIVNSEKPSEKMLESYQSYLMPLLDLQKNINIKTIVKTELIKFNENGIVHSPYKILKVLKEILNV